MPDEPAHNNTTHVTPNNIQQYLDMTQLHELQDQQIVLKVYKILIMVVLVALCNTILVN